MRSQASILLFSVLVSACSGKKSVQVHPPVPVPTGMVWGYGVEKLHGDPGRSQNTAYLKALDDLLSRDPAPSRTASPFKSRASRILQPSFVDTGVAEGFVWVLAGITQDELDRAWDEFQRAAQLEEFQIRYRELTDSGQLLEAERSLDEALRLGLDPTACQEYRTEVLNRRKQGLAEMIAGDQYFRDENYKGALERYREAGRLDRDNPQLPAKIAMAEEQHRAGRIDTVRVTAQAIGWGARIVGDYLNQRREEERRKREEAERQERRKEKEAARSRDRERSRRESSPPPNPPAPALAPPVAPPATPPTETAPEETPAEKRERLLKKPPPPL